jgi:hypothetical protein
VKWRRWARIWWRHLIEETLSPLTEPSGRFQIVSVLVLLIVIFAVFDMQTVSSEVLSFAVPSALLWVIPVFILWNAIIAIFRTRKSEAGLGRWYGPRFVYREPQFVATVPVTNSTPIPIKVDDAEIGSLADLRVVFDARDPLVKAFLWIDAVGPNWHGNWGLLQRDQGATEIRIQPHRTIWLFTNKLPDRDPSLITVQMLGWRV